MSYHDIFNEDSQLTKNWNKKAKWTFTKAEIRLAIKDLKRSIFRIWKIWTIK